MTACFLITPTGEAMRSLRRYTARDDRHCPARGTWGHQASVTLDIAPITRDMRGFLVKGDERPNRDDPRWPAHCEHCGYAFEDDDPRVLDLDEIYLTPDGRQVHLSTRRRELLGVAPASAGAMWNAPWMADAWQGPDGRALYLRLPDGHDWFVDGPSRNGGSWTRSGEPPHLTVTPSIASPGYHGWLSAGVLSPDLEGRTYL